MKEIVNASLVELAGKAWTLHQREFMSPVTVIVQKQEPQQCGYTITIPEPNKEKKCVTISALKDTEWTQRFDEGLKQWPQGTAIAVQIFTDDFAPAPLTPATTEDIEECRAFLEKLAPPS